MESFIIFDNIKCYPCYKWGKLFGCVDDNNLFIMCFDCADTLSCPKYKKD